jgi:hypothetical protein
MFLRVGVCMKLSKDPWLDAIRLGLGYSQCLLIICLES